MSHSQFHCTGRVYLDLHGLIFETSICYWQDQPGSPQTPSGPAPRRVFRVVGAAPPDEPDGAKRVHRVWCDAEGLRNIVFAGDPRQAGWGRVRQGNRYERRAPLQDYWVRRGVSVSLPIGRPGRSVGDESGDPPRAGPPGHRGEPAGRRNRPPEHRHEAGRRRPSDGRSRFPIGQWKSHTHVWQHYKAQKG